METLDAIRARRNVRQYTSDPIGRAELERILDAARLAPSARNWQPWDLVVVTERDQLVELAKVWQGAGHVAHAAAAVALVVAEPDEEQRDILMYDLGQATAYLMLAATDLGIASAHAAVRDQAQAQRVLGFPDGRFCAFLVALGHPAEGPLRPLRHLDRRQLDDVVHWGRW